MDARPAPVSHRTVVSVLVASVVTSVFHYLDNYLYIDEYPQPDWIHRETVWIVWVLFTLLGAAAYLLYRNGSYGMTGAYMLVYSYTGLSSFGHYFYGAPEDFSTRMHVSIVADVVVGTAVALCGLALMIRARRRTATT
jgi:tryptophan-rich sensory protein